MIKKFVNLLKKEFEKERDEHINALIRSAGASERVRDTHVARIAAIRWALEKVSELYKADESDVEILEDGEVPLGEALKQDRAENPAEKRRRLRGNPSRWGSE